MGVEMVVGFLVAWAVGKARRVGKQVNGLTDQTLEVVVDQVWMVVAAKLGADPAIQRLVTEARETGDASVETRASAAASLQQAVQQDQRFAAQLRAAAPDDGDPHHSAPRNVNSSVNTGDIYAGGSVDISNKVINYARRNPMIALFAVIVAAVVVWLVVTNVQGSTGADHGGATALVGTWTASDRSGTKVFRGNGPCEGFYYNNGAPLDIGGPMTCTISSTPDAQGRYTLTVMQAPNQDSYKVAFDSTDHAVVYTDSGQKLYEMQRS